MNVHSGKSMLGIYFILLFDMGVRLHIMRSKRWLIDFRKKLPRKIIQGSEHMQVKIIVKTD